MKNYRPLLFEGIDLRIADLQVRCLRLNRHTPEAQPEPHVHEHHGQLLVYLSGTGLQRIDQTSITARPGTVMYVAPGSVHAFQRQRSRRPLCLVVDVVMHGESAVSRPCAQLTSTGLTRIRSRLSTLFAYRSIPPDQMLLRLGSIILEVLEPVLQSLGWNGMSSIPEPRRSVTRQAERALADVDVAGSWNESLRELAQRIGFQQDYLNRLLKAECGLTLGQLRAKSRLGRAQKLLNDRQLSIGEIAERIGMLDSNYFARWFKQQTGLTPSGWRAS